MCWGACWTSTTSHQAEYDQAKASPMESRLHGASIEVDAPYVAEMVRNDMQSKYGDDVYTAGYKVFTTIDSRLQAAATVALRTGLMEYDRRHGYRGASAKVDLTKITTAAELDGQLEEFPVIGGLKPAIVEQGRGQERQDLCQGSWVSRRCHGKSWHGRGANCPKRKSTARPPRRRKS